MKLTTFAIISLLAFLVPLPPTSSAQPAAPEGMVFIEGGCFEMGSNTGEPDEKPVHKVCLEDFYIDQYEVTQAAFEKETGKNTSYFKGCSDCPVEQVDWKEAGSFCGKMGKRLPTEAEWEYAARSGGKKEKYAGINDELDIDDYAWFGHNSGSKTHPVGQKKPNALELYDIGGNVWEWVADWYGASYYSESPEQNPNGPTSGDKRVLRGGSWFNNSDYLRASNRGYDTPDSRVFLTGFRCAQSIEIPSDGNKK